MSSEKLNIQPNASILGVFSRLNYRPWYAIGEFVDNSTASFFGHETIMKFYKLHKLTVSIDYDSFKNILTITDDAYGMELEDFKRAVLLDQKPDNLNGRNEFGMGLKTAASWFGNKWLVKSTRLGSTNKYFAEIDINKLKEENINTIDIITSKTDKLTHGTTIQISEITKPIDASSTKKKIKDLLSSMYRRDINSGKVDIYFNGEKLFFDDYKVLNFRGNEWKKEVNFTFEFNGNSYNVDGFVGIMEKGSFPKAGLALFRYNRVVIGGFDSNYKPYAIFGQPQSQISLKLFGELNMESFPVNQAKDGFVWDNGLEDEFLRNLKLNIQDYISIANLSKDARIKEEEISSEKSDVVEENVKNIFSSIVLDEDFSQYDKTNDTDHNESDDISLFKKEMEEDNKLVSNSSSKYREYPIMLDSITTKTFKVSWQIGTDDKWIDYDQNNAEIIININHPFFKPYSADEKFKEVLEYFVVSFICAEELAKKASGQMGGAEGYMLPSVFRNKMNTILKKICKNK